MTTASFATGKEEGLDRFIDEIGTEVIWLGGIPAFKWLFDKTVFKSLGLDAKFDARNLTNKNVLEKIQQFAPNDEIKENIAKILKKESLFKNAVSAKFVVSTTMAIASYVGLTHFKQKYTENKIREGLIAEYEAKQNKQANEQTGLNGSKNPSFKGLSSVVQDFAFDPVKNMWILDGAITAERLKDSRSPQEFVGYGIKEASTLLFMYYFGDKIQGYLEKRAAEKGKSISLDARVLEGGDLKKTFDDGSITKSLEQFKSACSTPESTYDFLHKNPDNMIVKVAKESDVISMYKESQGLFKKAKVSDKIDTRRFIDLEKINAIKNNIEELYSNYQKALLNGETSEAFFEGVKKLKRKSIITNIGTCILALGVVTPVIMLAKRLMGKDDSEFQTKKEIREQLIKEGRIA